MAAATPQTIGSALFVQVEQLFVDPSAGTPFVVANLKRQADKLQAVDAIESSVVKSAIAAYEWDREMAKYWVENALKLGRSTTSLVNAAVTMGALNDFKSAREYSLEAVDTAPNDLRLRMQATTALAIGGYYSEAIRLTDGIESDDAEVQKERASLLKAVSTMHEIGLAESQMQIELAAAYEVAASNQVRITQAHPSIIRDPDGGKSLAVSLIFLGTLETEMKLEEDFSRFLADNENWDPLKLNVEFEHVLR